jgi:hypothetical protein
MTAAQLDEFAAWCEMAMLCEGPLWTCSQGCCVALGDPRADGLCDLIDECEYEEVVGSRMERNRPPGAPSFWWPLTRKGWDARAAFCWRMAEMVEREAT